MKLYEVTDAVINVRDLLAEGVIDDDAASDTLAGILPLAEDKVRAISALMLNRKHEIEGLKQAEERFAVRRKRAQESLAWFDGYLLKNMQECGLGKVDADDFVVSLQDNPIKVIVDDASKLLKKYITKKVTETPDKKAIKEALVKDGKSVKGAHMEQTQRVVIK